MIKIHLTGIPSKANLITHGGVFHADDVMATVILAKALGGEVTVCRTHQVPSDLKEGTIVYDVGCGKFDHHQKDGNGRRKNRVPYAACGLVWKAFGDKITEGTSDPHFLWRSVDNELIQGIDAIDCGEMPNANYPAHSMTFSRCVFLFNPTGDDTETFDEAFLKAVAFSEVVFDNVFKNALSKLNDRAMVENAIENANGNIMILDRFAKWHSVVLNFNRDNAKKILFVIFPVASGGYNWNSVPSNPNNREFCKLAPVAWRGLKDEELQRVSGVESAIFCHPAGHIGGAATLEDAIAMAKRAAEF